MQTYPAVNCPRLLLDRSPHRFLPYLVFVLSPLLAALLLVHTPRSALAQTGLRPTAGQFSQQPAEQPPLPDTGQTKINQPQPTVASTIAATVALTPIRDDQGIMSIAVPAGWNDVAQGEWRIAGAPAGRTLSASPSQADFATNWGTPGVALFHSTSLPAAMEPEDVLAVFDYSATCEDGGRGTLPPAQRNVIYQIWQNCAGTGTAAAVLLISPAVSRDFYAVVEVYMASVEDLRTLGPLLRSVRFDGGEATLLVNGDDTAGTEAAATATPAATLSAPPSTPAPTPTLAPVLATVITDRLNLRSGPSTEVPRLTVVTTGTQLTVTGQAGNCAWLRVTAPDGQQGWVSGDPQFTSLGAACETIPVVESP
jgi:hypothetical protein